jgi:hypothetical protein
MTKNLTAIALEKGYRVELEPEYIHLPKIGYFRLPMWLSCVKLYISPKGTPYTLEALAFKLKRKADRARLKMILKERKRNLQERQSRNEQLKTYRYGRK